MVFFYLSAVLIWIKIYLVHRFGFDLPVKGWYQELILGISPASSVLLLLALGSLALRRFSSGAAAVAASFGAGCLLLANLVYYRFFNDFITMPVLLQSTQLGELGQSILYLIRPLDALVFADTLVLLALALRRRFPIGVPNRFHIAAMLSSAIVLFGINWVMAEQVRPDLLLRTFDRHYVVKSIGAINYQIYDAIVNARMEARKALSGHERLSSIQSAMEQAPKDSLDPNMFGLAKGRNVFLISLESLESFVLEKSFGDQVITPFMNDLLKHSYTFENFYQQTGQGKTSDAEFIIDTMLYPLPRGAVYFTHSGNTFHSIPEQLKESGYYTAVFHGNNKTFWNRDIMYRTMGYQRFFSASDYDVTKENSIGWGLKDIPFFEQSVDMAQSLPQPFFAKMITLTNHFPFTLNKEDQFIAPFTTSSSTLNRYLLTVRYTDEALKRFFEKVKAAGLYHNSIFVLYGDHGGISKKHYKAMAQILGKEKLTAFDDVQLQRVPLIIHIPGKEGSKMSTVGGQIDVKPTLLHLLGLEPVRGLGFGHDLFAKNRQQIAVLRNGTVITEDYIFAGSSCYDKKTGEKTDAGMSGLIREKAANQLKASDKIIYGDMMRTRKQ